MLVNKRLDEWVMADRLDIKKLQFPKKEAKTPTKNGVAGSRPSSPEREVVSWACTIKCLSQHNQILYEHSLVRQHCHTTQSSSWCRLFYDKMKRTMFKLLVHSKNSSLHKIGFHYSCRLTHFCGKNAVLQLVWSYIGVIHVYVFSFTKQAFVSVCRCWFLKPLQLPR